MRNKEESLLTTEEAAAYLGLRYGQLCMWRIRQTGPRFLKHVDATIAYRKADLDEFLAASVAKVIEPTAPLVFKPVTKQPRRERRRMSA